MLQLKPYNLLIQKTVSEAVEAAQQGRPLALDRIISDFDYTTFHMYNTAEDQAGTVYLSVRTKAWQSVLQCGGLLEYLQEVYSGCTGVTLLQQPEQGYDLTLALQLTSSPTEDTVLQLSLLKTHIMASPFKLAFKEFDVLKNVPVDPETAQLQQGPASSLFAIQYRDDETIFIKPANDRITVIFDTVFEDETDKIFGKVFLQEFVDARKRNRSIQSAPQVLYSHERPLELGSSNHPNLQGQPSRGYITFVLFPRHFQTQEVQLSSVYQLVLFRNYFHYHIKCAKAYMHSRMRYRVNTFVKVLNRAKVDDDDNDNQPAAESSTGATSTGPTRRTATGRKLVY
ncbi:Arc35p KNAG_0D00330 [Huiozyma naganishii CBS 8797]|uniref:Arp2/3 complex 34 kDa subunit n=1 Tax=Huiozyma naganishii (strain ATCC MYA-139 / BCRC 22969 / CBS 8797 / KCTC 17520 / NBRC 10181 / NCYC 3082 / Yp74L-3) TaxID=1071383 RepID=J7S6I7_HUIN7|nr:hypothetical protein KNAG_0D00330 [Kazachstania naganishii CBS 8797]CCK69786.1 hypothetical protein KNAG_0D00330 [Kazachstania naganishii CBS 8797]